MGIASVTRWVKNPIPKQTRNKPATKIDMIALARDVQEYPDAYQAERAGRLGVSEKGIGYALRRMNISYKKTLQHPKADEDKRHTFQETIKSYKAQNRVIVYIDESGFAHDMPRTHGYAPIGKRCYGKCNWHERGRIHVIGALIVLTVGSFKNNIDADTFFGWTAQDLLPTLPPASGLWSWITQLSIKDRIFKYVITQARHTLEYLPAYSPDLNPIEHKWAQTQAVRKQHNQTVEQLSAIGVGGGRDELANLESALAFDGVESDEIQGEMSHHREVVWAA